MNRPQSETNGGAPTQAPETEKTIWNCSYAYDVPYYADFTIEAESEEKALRIAEALLESGTIQEIFDARASANIESADGERVFVSGEDDDDNAHEMHAEYSNLAVCAAREKVKLPEGWENPPEAPEAKPERPAPLTLAEAIDAFPVLTGHRHGTAEHDGRLLISDPSEFIATAGTHGSGAKHAAAFIASLAGYNIPKAWATLRGLLDAIDSQHQEAAGRVFMAAMHGGLR